MQVRFLPPLPTKQGNIMAINRVVKSPKDYKPQIDLPEAISKRTQDDPNKLVKLMEKYAKAHHQMADIFEAHDLDVQDMRNEFTKYGEIVTDLYNEVIDD